MIDENKIEFIICYNDDLYVNECIRYISLLNVPEGMEISISGIAGAESMAAGYNAAMVESNARYKVYLHQDVFIINRDFIKDVVDIFKEHKEYGMLGVVGSTQVISDANYWDRWNIGITQACDGALQLINEMGKVPKEMGIVPVAAIDGMIMITQYDLVWREDICDGFDFYDISQAAEFSDKGYKVGVPLQKEIWCNHDCGPSNLQYYDLYRERFCEAYSEQGYKYKVDQRNESLYLNGLEAKKCVAILSEMLNEGHFEEVDAFFRNIKLEGIKEKTLITLGIIFKIIRSEKEHNLKQKFYKAGMCVDELLEKFIRYKFFLRRVEHDFLDYTMDIEWQEIVQRREVIIDLPIIAETACVNATDTLNKLQEKLFLETGKKYCFLQNSEINC